MIHSDEGLRRTREAMGILERILALVERDKDKMHPSWYETQKEPVVEQLAELQAEIDQYVRVTSPSASESATNMRVPA